MTVPDARTTPRALRPLQMLLILALAFAWFDASFYALDRPTFRQYLMGWKMFTMKNTRGTDHRAEVRWRRDGPYESVDLHSYFPARWGSGYRYSRFRDQKRLQTVAGALCHRLEEPAYAVRVIQVRWTLEPGDLSRANAKEEVMAFHRCARRMRVLGHPMPLHPDLAAAERP